MRRPGVVAAIVLALLIGGAAAAPAAAAAPPLLEVSRDGGRTYSADPRVPLFDTIERIVPGDAESETFWVRSGAASDGRLRIDLTDVRADDLRLAAATTLTVRVAGEASATTVIIGDALGACFTVSQHALLSPGATARVDAVLAVDPDLGSAPGDPGDAGAGGRMSFGMRVTLSDAAAGEGAGCGGAASPAPRPTDALAVTGGGGSMGAVIGALATGAAGAVLLARRRVRERT